MFGYVVCLCGVRIVRVLICFCFAFCSVGRYECTESSFKLFVKMFWNIVLKIVSIIGVLKWCSNSARIDLFFGVMNFDFEVYLCSVEN